MIPALDCERLPRPKNAIGRDYRGGAIEVLVAPIPKPINQTYGEDEMFIG